MKPLLKMLLLNSFPKEKTDERKEKKKVELFYFGIATQVTPPYFYCALQIGVHFYSSYGNKKFRAIACNAGNYTLHSFIARCHLGTLLLNHIVCCVFVL